MFRSCWTRLVIAIIALTAVPLLNDSLVNPRTIPDAQLAEWRGLNRKFTKTLAGSCAANAQSSLLLIVPPNTPVAQTCDGTNNGTAIGGCTVKFTSVYGRLGINLVNPGTGQDNQVVSTCGNLQAGQCGPLPVPLVGFGMVGVQNVTDGQGNQISCDDLYGIKAQPAPGPLAINAKPAPVVLALQTPQPR